MFKDSMVILWLGAVLLLLVGIFFVQNPDYVTNFFVKKDLATIAEDLFNQKLQVDDTKIQSVLGEDFYGYSVSVVEKRFNDSYEFLSGYILASNGKDLPKRVGYIVFERRFSNRSIPANKWHKMYSSVLSKQRSYGWTKYDSYSLGLIQVVKLRKGDYTRYFYYGTTYSEQDNKYISVLIISSHDLIFGGLDM